MTSPSLIVQDSVPDGWRPAKGLRSACAVGLLSPAPLGSVPHLPKPGSHSPAPSPWGWRISPGDLNTMCNGHIGQGTFGNIKVKVWFHGGVPETSWKI